MHWVFLCGAGAFEVVFTTLLKESDGFTRLWPTIGFMVASTISFYLLTLSMRGIPLGTAYLVWTSVGAFGTTAVGIFFFGDPVTIKRVAFMTIIFIGVCGLWLSES